MTGLPGAPTKAIIRNIFWLLVEHGTRMGLGLIVTAVLARQLGVEDYGIFQYVIGLVSIFAALSYVCGAEVLVPQLAKVDDHTRRQLLGNAFAVRMIFSSIGYIALLSFGYLTQTRQVFSLMCLIGVSILVAESFGVVTAWLQSQTNSKPRSLLVMAALATKAAIVTVLFFAGVDKPIYYAYAYVVEPLIIAIGLLLVYRRATGSGFFSFSPAIAVDLLKRGLPFFSGLLVMSFFLRMDLVVVKYFADPSTLGHYSAALRLASQVNLVAPMLVMSMAPSLVYKFDETPIIRRNVLRISLVLLGVAFAGAVFVQVVAPKVVPMLFGSQYVPSIPILRALVWISCLIFFNEGLNIYLLKMAKGSWVTTKWAITLASAIVAYALLVPRYEVFGVIAGTALGYAAATVFLIFIIARTEVKDRT